MARSGDVAPRTLQGMLGHASFTTTQKYAHYFPGEHEGDLIDRAFSSPKSSPKLSENQANSDQLESEKTLQIRLDRPRNCERKPHTPRSSSSRRENTSRILGERPQQRELLLR
jgi:hypothetical protein